MKRLRKQASLHCSQLLSVHFTGGGTGTSPAANRDWCLVMEKHSQVLQCSPIPCKQGLVSAARIRKHRLQGSWVQAVGYYLLTACKCIISHRTAAGCQKCNVPPQFRVQWANLLPVWRSTWLCVIPSSWDRTICSKSCSEPPSLAAMKLLCGCCC